MRCQPANWQLAVFRGGDCAFTAARLPRARSLAGDCAAWSPPWGALRQQYLAFKGHGIPAAGRPTIYTTRSGPAWRRGAEPLSHGHAYMPACQITHCRCRCAVGVADKQPAVESPTS